MIVTRLARALVLLTILAALALDARADQGSLVNAGGTTAVSAGVHVTGNVALPPGTLTLDCPTVSPGRCAGGSFTFLAADGQFRIDASFTSGSFAETCWGGGRGGHVTCAYTFIGLIAGTTMAGSVKQAIDGVTRQIFGTGGAAAQGVSAYNSAYTPFYYSDSEQILRSDDLQGTNQIVFGTQGSGPGQFYGAYGIALDSAGRIYVADTYNCRIARINDMTGAGWTSYGTCGSSQGEFSDPSGLAVDAAGRIYVLDAGNARVVRMDDMSGANWASYGTPGTGTGQFSGSVSSVAVDTAGRIYVPDTGNKRLVRFDDMSGANWIALTQSVPVGGVTYTLQSPSAVAVDAAGRIYIAENQPQPAVVRVDDMTGANWTAVATGASSGLNSIGVDSSGTPFTGGGGVHLVDGMTAVMNSSGSIGPIGSYYVFGVTPIPLPSPRPSAVSLSPAALTFTQDAGTVGTQDITVSNFGSSPLHLGGVSANGGFSATDDCPDTLEAGSVCTVSVTYAPPAAGQASGQLTIDDDSGNLGSTQTIALTGTTGCQDTLALSDSSETLNIGFTLSTPTPATWATWLVIGNVPVQLWSVTVPPLSPPVSFNVPLRGFPALGNVTVATALTAGGQIACYDVEVVNTGD